MMMTTPVRSRSNSWRAVPALSSCLLISLPATKPTGSTRRGNQPRMIWAMHSARFSGVQQRMSMPTLRSFPAVALLYAGRAS